MVDDFVSSPFGGMVGMNFCSTSDDNYTHETFSGQVGLYWVKFA